MDLEKAVQLFLQLPVPNAQLLRLERVFQLNLYSFLSLSCLSPFYQHQTCSEVSVQAEAALHLMNRKEV